MTADENDPRFSTFPPHPRLLLTPAVAESIRRLRETDPLLASLLQRVKTHADIALTQPLPGGDMKERRRISMFRVFNMGLMYQLDGDVAYATRIRTYLLDAVSWSDWGGQWLNTGEMAAWTALGYDWIYGHLSPAERDTIRNGIVNIAINRGLSAHAAGNEHWLKSADNWNQVCNGGLVLAALATAEHAVPSARQQEINDKAHSTVQNALRSYGFVIPAYAPDGDWFEGPTYYAYGATYQALALQAMQDAYGDVRGLDALAGFEAFGRSGEHFIQAVGPTGLYFNHGDAKTTCFFTPLMFWLSRHFGRSDYAFWERGQVLRDLARMAETSPVQVMSVDTLDRFMALSAIWYNPVGDNEEAVPLRKAQVFRGNSAAGAMRTGWGEDAVYLGFKGGYPAADHAHMDCGSFVLDAGGLRWAMDLGYEGASSLPDYYGSKRWNYYHSTNQGHNSLVINGLKQRASGKASVVDFRPVPGGQRGIVNLSNVYDNASVHRGFTLLDDGRVLVEDRILTTAPSLPVRWGMVTPADVTLHAPGIALLRQQGQTLRARLLAPAGADFSILSTNPYELNPAAPANQNTNPGTRMLAVVANSPASGEMEITVLLERVEDEAAELPAAPLLRPVLDWRRDVLEDTQNRSLYQSWKQTQFAALPGGIGDPLAMDDADPNANRVVNRLEYALAGAPLDDDDAVLPQIEKDQEQHYLRLRRWSGGQIEADGAYRTRGIRYSLEQNTSLTEAEWIQLPQAWENSLLDLLHADGSESIRIPLPTPEAPESLRLFRLSVFFHTPEL